LEQEQPHPKKLKKITRQVPQGDPCGTSLALTLQRKMDVGLNENGRDAMDGLKCRGDERMIPRQK